MFSQAYSRNRASRSEACQRQRGRKGGLEAIDMVGQVGAWGTCFKFTGFLLSGCLTFRCASPRCRMIPHVSTSGTSRGHDSGRGEYDVRKPKSSAMTVTGNTEDNIWREPHAIKKVEKPCAPCCDGAHIWLQHAPRPKVLVVDEIGTKQEASAARAQGLQGV